jgi:hypothetical protein
MPHQESANIRRCLCRACENHRRYQRMHPEKHNKDVKAHYNRNQEKILLQKAYGRFLAGQTKKLHKRTIIRLQNAGFFVDIPVNTAYKMSNVDSLTHGNLPKMLATEAC